MTDFVKLMSCIHKKIELNKLECKLKYGRYCVVQDKYFFKNSKEKSEYEK